MDKAVAVKYARGLPAPFVVAKGRHELAQRLIEIAESSGVEIV
ncbi:MAG TPA: EscU/YscU/HrcU family type III secretion system export apparatus switch protein, partial [Spirochaetia bacterium]|nr:EscU/YscU/HrcU family type III secretion system export apparatus switch protein [Spirochaetia bacterium]